MQVEQLLIQYEGTSFIPTKLASQETDVVFDYVEFVLRNSMNVRRIRITFE